LEEKEKPDYIESDVIDLRQIIEVLRKWRRVIIAITLLAVITSAIMSFYVIDPVYEAKSMLVVTMPVADPSKVGTGESGNNDLESVISTVSRMPYMTMNTYVGQLTSDTMYERTVKNLGLERQGYSGKNLTGMVKVEVAKDSNIIMLKVQHTDPRLAADVANGLGEEYLAYLSEENQRKMTQSTDFLSSQKDETDQKLEKILGQMKNFNSDSRSVEFLQKQFENLTTDLNTYQTNLDAARVQVQQLEAGVASLREKLNSTPQMLSTSQYSQSAVEPVEPVEPAQPAAPMVTEEINPVYISLSEKLNEKEAELAEKRASLAANQATVSRLLAELTTLQVELSGKQIDQQKLQNEITRLQETQNLLAQKVTQTQIARSIDMGDTTINIASPALVPSGPVKPNKQLNVAVALVLGLMVSIGLAFVLEFMDNTFKSPEDVQKHLGLPVVGTIPANKGTANKSRRSFFGLRRA